MKAFLESEIQRFEQYVALLLDDPAYKRAVKAREKITAQEKKKEQAYAKMQKAAKDFAKQVAGGADPDDLQLWLDDYLEGQQEIVDKAEKALKPLVKKFNESGNAHKYANVQKEVRRVEQAIDKLRVLISRFSGGDFATLESLATVSVSIHEPKGMVRKLGYRNPTGYTRSTRTIAGTMIFTIIDQHPLAQLMALDPQSIVGLSGGKGNKNPAKLKWMMDQDKGVGTSDEWEAARTWIRTPTDLSPFHLVLDYVTEYAGAQQWADGRSAAAGRGRAMGDLAERETFVAQEIDKIDKQMKDAGKPTDSSKQSNVPDYNKAVAEEQAYEKMGSKKKLYKEEAKDLATRRKEMFSGPAPTINLTPGKGPGYGNLKTTLMLEHVEFISGGMVTSVNDMVSEYSLQFIASNIYEISNAAKSPLSSFPEIGEIMAEFAYMASADKLVKQAEDRRAAELKSKKAASAEPEVGEVKTVVNRPPDEPGHGLEDTHGKITDRYWDMSEGGGAEQGRFWDFSDD